MPPSWERELGLSSTKQISSGRLRLGTSAITHVRVPHTTKQVDVTTGAVCRIHDLTKKSERILNDCVCTVVEKLDADPNHPDALPKVKVTIDETAPKNFVPQPGKEEYKPPKDLVGTEVEVSILNLETDETDETHEARVKKIELEQVLTPPLTLPMHARQCNAPLQ